MWKSHTLKRAAPISKRRPLFTNFAARAFLSTHNASAFSNDYVWSTRSRHEVTSYNNNSGGDRSFSVPLTVSDVHLRHEQLPFAYYFRETLDAQLLKSSLRRVLRHFPVVGGRIKPEIFQSIDCGPTDSVPLSFGDVDVSLNEWLSEARGHSYVAGKGHPVLLPLFDPLFDNENNNETESSIQLPYDNLLKIRVTYFQCGGTALGVNFLHTLGDTASCIRFVSCWGREMSRQSYPQGACNVRANANVSGMMTQGLAELMGLTQPPSRGESRLVNTGFFDWFSMGNANAQKRPPDMLPAEEAREHEYVQLCFPAEVLLAMKEVGMASFQRHDAMDSNHHQTFVSTNDMISAFGWLLKRSLSGEHNWNLSMVVNMRGRCGVDAFTGMEDDDVDVDPEVAQTRQVEGLFGNGITNIVAVHPSTAKSFDICDVTRAARSIRQALDGGITQLPDRLLQSKMGKSQHVCTAQSFPTTSWSQFKLKDISFTANQHLAGFHGCPSHPLPDGQSTYSSVITKAVRCGAAPRVGSVASKFGVKYNLLLPSSKAREAQKIHLKLCKAFLRAQAELGQPNES